MIKYSAQYWEDIKSVIKHIPNIDRLYGKSVLITGATGMICSVVAEIIMYLNAYENANVKLFLAGRSKERVRKRFADIDNGMNYYYVHFDAVMNEIDDIENVDYVIYGASPAGPSMCAMYPVETILSNISGLSTVLDNVKGVKKFLYISSSEVYGRKESTEPFKENDYGFVDILNSRACYPSAKRAAETLCIAYSDEKDIDISIVRPGHIYGPSIIASDSRATAQFMRNIADNNDIVMKSAGTQLRSYCYTNDCASAILCVLINGYNKKAYNISNKGSICSIRQIAQEMATASGHELIFEEASDYEKNSYNLMDNSSLTSSSIEELGWSAEFDLKKGVASMIRDYINE